MNASRIGNFTSSEIAALMAEGKTKGSLGKPALNYIDECNIERRLGRSISEESNARPLTWGKLVERRVFDLLGLEYTLCSDKLIAHPEIDCWKGSPDATKTFVEGTVADIKCPQTLKSFCTLADAKDTEALRNNHKDGEKFYWQLVSNSILTGCPIAELIVYCPYKSELEAIRELARGLDSPDQYRYLWISNANDEELPWIPEGGHYKNINILRFEVPESDKIALAQRVGIAQALLIDFKPEPAIQ